MKNSRTYIFVCSDTEVNAKALHYGHKAKKNFIAASKAFQDDYHAQVAIHCGMARLGPKKQRLTRAEWKAQKRARYESRSSGECGARFRCDQEKEAHKRLQADAGACGTASKEKRATREAMQKALALQAEARRKSRNLRPF